MKKTKVFTIATAWKFKDILKNHLENANTLGGGYIGAKYRKVKVTVTVEKA